MRTPLAAFARSARGTAVIEFTIAVPIMMLLVAAIAEFGLILNVYNQTNRLATQYAIAWAACSDDNVQACKGELPSYASPSTIGNVAPRLTPGNVVLQMVEVTMTGAVPTPTYAYPTGSALSSDQVAAAQATLADRQVGVVVTVAYTHTLLFERLMSPFLADRLRPTHTVVQLKG